MAKLVVDVLNRAYNTIQSEQVGELSQRMNRLFAKMAANVSDEDFDEIRRDKATLKMIVEVGLRPVADKPDDYEIYALNSRGRLHATNRNQRRFPPSARTVIRTCAVRRVSDLRTFDRRLVAQLHVRHCATQHATRHRREL